MLKMQFFLIQTNLLQMDMGKCKTKGEWIMWVVTVFTNKDVRMFEYANKEEATKTMETYAKNAILSYTK